MESHLNRITDGEAFAKQAGYRIAERAPAATTESDRVADCIDRIKSLWARGAGSTLELAKVLADIRRRLPYGRWSHLWESDRLPFSKRKGEMLVGIGERLAWLDAQTFAHLPAGWSILYCLAQLKREFFQKLVAQGAIHPRLKLHEAKELVAKSNGRGERSKSRTTNVQRRLFRFRDYVRRTFSEWQPAERALAERELTGLLELVSPQSGADRARDPGDDRATWPRAHRIFMSRCTAALRPPQQPQITV